MEQRLRCCLREKHIFDQGHRHFFSGPETEGLGSLVEEHIGTVEGGEAFRPGHGKEPGLLWIIDNVGDDEAVRKEGCVGNGTGILVGGHSQGGGVGQDPALGQLRAQPVMVRKIAEGDDTACLSFQSLCRLPGPVIEAAGGP